METDKQLYKLFTAAPGQLYLLLGLPAPKEVRARAETFKDVQTESDLVAEPGDEAEPARLVDFQAYRDKKFVPKVMLRCALYRLQHPGRPMRSHVVYLDREFESAPVDDGGLFQPTVHYLPELFRQLTIQPSAAETGGDTENDRETSRSRRNPLGQGTERTLDRRGTHRGTRR